MSHSESHPTQLITFLLHFNQTKAPITTQLITFKLLHFNQTMNKKAHQLPAGQEWVKQHTGVYSYLAVPPACRVNLILVATEAILNKVTHHNSSLLQGQQLGQKSLVLLKLPSVDRDMLGIGCQVFHQNADKVCNGPFMLRLLLPLSVLLLDHIP